MKRALLVSDDLDQRKRVGRELVALGLQVDEAGCSCGPLLANWEKASYSLIVADVDLLHKAEALFFLRFASLCCPTTPILVLCPSASMKDLATAFRYGASDVLDKPDEKLKLQQKIRQWIS